MSCGYQGYEFGAHYLDSVCIDGKLWDADSGCGDCLDNGGDIPCPQCCRPEWMEYYRASIIEVGEEQGYEAEKPKTVKYGGFPDVVRADIDAMRKARRWIKRGWYRGRKERQKQEREFAS